MANTHTGYRSWHLDRLKDDESAACFLAAAMEDAISENDMMHFIHALNDVVEAKGISHREAVELMRNNCGDDAHNVEENKNIFLVRLVQIVQQNEKRNLQEA